MLGETLDGDMMDEVDWHFLDLKEDVDGIALNEKEFVYL
jgi:hypothetical protein